MKMIQKGSSVFCVDIESTKAYYSSHSICDCCNCRNYYAQIKTLSAELNEFLSEFGIDAARPDEASSIEMENSINYLFVGYTVNGKIETKDQYETDIENYHIVISNGNTPFYWFPNEQEEPCFFVSVSGITLPWVLEEPFPHEERFIGKVARFFQKSK